MTSGGDGVGGATPASTASSGGGECTLEEMAPGGCRHCLAASCCAEAEACLGALDECAPGGGGVIDESTPLGAALFACMGEHCSAACGVTVPAPICGSRLSANTDEPHTSSEFVACFNASCCEELAPCVVDGDQDACVECLSGHGDDDRCAAADRCAVASCGGGLASVHVCGTALHVHGLEEAACVESACCAEVEACTSGGDDVAACESCLDDGGGPLCDALRTCRAELCGL